MNTIIVSTGDSAGVSPDLIPFLLANRSDRERLVFVGPESLREVLLNQLGKTDLQGEILWEIVGELSKGKIQSGEPCAETGQVAYESFQRSMELTEEFSHPELLTLPLSKFAVNQAGYDNFIGHTEELEDFFNRRAVMAFFGEEFNVALLTRHIPLEKVPEDLSENLVISQVKTVRNFFTKRRKNVSFALLGLNPHAGERGSIGVREKDILEPALEELKKNGISIEGPVPADGYIPGKASKRDMIFACYHDQGLAPFKANHFHSGVHASLGFPVLRVSPDHGVASDLAGTGRVNPISIINCLKWLRSHRKGA